ncbi:MAG: ABC transporter permease [Patescibacteria group bacterium]|nr:ABC transporter permease [Patescibacteria group bacterium]MDE2438559.1 ABC transporter permease [Patescibacteria group bacterium]
MILTHTIKTAFTGLTTHKSRSLLTILGIVIGIAAIMVVMSLGQGAENLILGQVATIGSKTIAIIPGREPKGPTDFVSTFTDSLKERDLKLLENRQNVPHLDQVMPIVFGSEPAVYGSETYRPTIFGATPLFSDIFSLTPDEGDLFTDDDVASYASVAVIGAKVKTELFGNNDALNEKIKINGRNFRVVGVLGEKGQSSFVNFDEVVIVPYTTAQNYIFGIKYFNRLIVQADSEANVPATVEDVTTTLRDSHAITDSAKDDFFVQTQAQAIETVSNITNIIKLFLAAVAAISLIVGGVGIMNIMLVSVTERTREIGLRKAIGATSYNILSQFLVESMMLTSAGGALGIGVGTLVSFAASWLLTHFAGFAWIFSFPWEAALLGIGVSMMIGLLFGIYPAYLASQLSPTEALRYE